MAQVSVAGDLPTATPTLLLITKVSNPLPATTYSVYYRNHTRPDHPSFKNINQLKELFLPHRELQLRVINFEEEKDAVLVTSDRWEENGEEVKIEVGFGEYMIELWGRVINRSGRADGVVDMSVVQKRGYEDFYKFRKKYKALQNITKQLEFHIDHRLIAEVGGKRYQFNL